MIPPASRCCGFGRKAMRIYWMVPVPILLLCSCAREPTSYQRAERAWAEGFSEKRIAEGTFYITYRANRKTPGRVVCGYLYRRAAEVTLRYGFQYFAVIRGPRVPMGLEVHHVYSEDRDDWEPIVEETPVSGTLFMTIQCLKEVQEVPGARLIDAKRLLEKNPNPWTW
jgi:hypothetical protein